MGMLKALPSPKSAIFQDRAGLIFANQQVLRLEISVHDPMDVTVGHSLHQLVHEALQAFQY